MNRNASFLVLCFISRTSVVNHGTKYETDLIFGNCKISWYTTETAEMYVYLCKMLPTMLFLDHNGKTIHKVEGKKTLSEMKMIVEQVLSTSCTGLDEKLDEASGSHQGSVCCEGLVKETMGNERLCVKQYCVENSELGIQFNGDARAALSCCDDSAKRRIISKISGFIVHCVQPTNEMDNTSRVISKRDFIPDVRYKKKKLGSKVISH